jgi:hypothetical protein
VIKILMEADQAKAGDQILVAGLLYQVSSVVHEDADWVTINASRVVDAGSVTLRILAEAAFEVIPPQQTEQL